MPPYKRRKRVAYNVVCSICGDKIPIAVSDASGTAMCARCRSPLSPTCGKPQVSDDGTDEPLDALLKAIEDAE